VPTSSDPNIVAFIPARSGSKRVKDKNIRTLADHPLIAYSIAAAKASGIFDAIIVSTDSDEYAEIGLYYGAEVPFMRPAEFSGSKSPDIDWLDFTVNRLESMGYKYDCFSILRPTSPFRRAETIRTAWAAFKAEKGVDSLRAVEKCTQHPGKMWVVKDNRMVSLLPLTAEDQPWHSTQYAALPAVYIQNASLEIAWTRVIHELRTIAGNILMPFISEKHDGFDINNPEDWWIAEYLLKNGEVKLPHIVQEPYL